MKIIVLLLRILFLPLKIIVDFVYPRAPFVIGYSWYTKANYQEMVFYADDDVEDLVPTYKLWKERAVKTLDDMRSDKSIIVFKVRMDVKKMRAWLNKEGLKNTRNNREQYMMQHLQKFMKDPIL